MDKSYKYDNLKIVIPSGGLPTTYMDIDVFMDTFFYPIENEARALHNYHCEADYWLLEKQKDGDKIESYLKIKFIDEGDYDSCREETVVSLYIPLTYAWEDYLHPLDDEDGNLVFFRIGPPFLSIEDNEDNKLNISTGDSLGNLLCFVADRAGDLVGETEHIAYLSHEKEYIIEKIDYYWKCRHEKLMNMNQQEG